MASSSEETTTEKRLQALEEELRETHEEIQNWTRREWEYKAARDRELSGVKGAIHKLKASHRHFESTQYQFVQSYEQESYEVQKLLFGLYDQDPNDYSRHCYHTETILESTPLAVRMEVRRDPNGFASCMEEDDDDEDDDDDNDEQNKDDDDDDDDDDSSVADEDKIPIPEDSYAFIMLAQYECGWGILPALVAWFVIAFQVLTFTVLLFNMMDPGNENGNIFSFPQNVDSSTRMAEVLAIIIGVVIEEDTRTAILLWYDGYKNTTYSTPITQFHWRCAVYGRFFIGLYDIFIMFVLIMASDNVIDLLLNFAAVQFISFLDNVAFALSEEGFLGQTCKEMAEEVQETYYVLRRTKPTHPTTTTRATTLTAPHNPKSLLRPSSASKKECFRIFLFVSVLVPLFTGWGYILHTQYAAHYSCQQLYIQFGDNVRPELSALSGRYTYQPRNGQVHYHLVENNPSTKGAILAFCQTDGMWTLSPYDLEDQQQQQQQANTRMDPCQDYIVKSDENEDLWNDVTATADLKWFVVQPSTGKEIILDYLRLFCSECVEDDDFCGDHGSCRPNDDNNNNNNNNGGVVEECICEEGWYGLRCDYMEPCPTLQINELFHDFDGFREWPKTYGRLSITNNNNNKDEYLSLLEHPVYYHDNNLRSSSSEGKEIDFIIFTGRRWILTSTSLLNDFPSSVVVSKETLVDYLQKEFHPYWSHYEYGFISETVDLDTSSDQISPEDLSWYQVPAATTLETAVFVYPSEAKLLCSICNDAINPCLSDGICNPNDGTCDCSSSGAQGVLCQLAPLKNGVCNPVFNLAEYDFDGGDCCQATCVSREFTCGTKKNAQQQQEQYVGYCQCRDSDYTECPNTNEVSSSCWLPTTVSITGLATGARSGASLAVSTDGTIVAVGEPGMDTVRIFENDGSQWIPLGETLHGDQSGSGFGSTLAMSSNGKRLVVSAPFYRQHEQNSAPTTTTGNLFVYELSGTNWQKLEEAPRTMPANLLSDDIFYRPSLSLSGTGSILYLLIQDSGLDKVLGFPRDERTGTYFPTTTTSMVSLSPFESSEADFTLGSSISTSSSGNVLAFDGKDAQYFDRPQVILTRYERDEDDEGNDFYSYQQIGVLDGCCCILSGDGNVVVVLKQDDPPKSEVYAFNSTGSWIVRGDHPLNGAPKALSYDGFTLAVLVEDGSAIATYFWNGTDWTYQGSVPGEERAEVVLSGGKDGGGETKMVVGMPSDNAMGPNAGQTFVYRWKKSDNIEEEVSCDRRSKIVRLELATDAYPTETIWEIRDRFTQKIIWSGGPYTQEDQYKVFVNETLELPEDVICAQFTIFDIAGDGLCCEEGFGSYNLYYGGLLQKSGGDFAWFDQHRFGDCERLCAEGRSFVKVEITLDDNPEETSFQIMETSSGTLALRGGPFPPESAGVTMSNDACLPSFFCVELTIFDEDGICCSSGFGSYTLSWDDEVIEKRGDFSKQTSLVAGNCEDMSTAQALMPPVQNLLSINAALPVNSGWTLYTIGSETTTSGTSSMNVDIEPLKCYLFEFLDFEKRNGVSRTGRFSLSVGQNLQPDTLYEFIPFGTYASGASFIFGYCYNVTTYFTLPAGDNITCSNEPSNVCKAPAACAYDGIALTAVGNEENVLGNHLMNNEWTTNGAYSLKFGSDCEVICGGTCNTVSTSPYQCGEGEVMLRVQLHFLDPINTGLRSVLKNYTYWTITTQKDEILLGGGLHQNGEIVNERTCIPEDACVFFNVLGYMRYIFFIDGEHFLSGNAKFFWESNYNEQSVGASETICPYLTGTFSASNQLPPTSDLGPWRSDQLCSTDAQQVPLDTNVSGSTIDATLQIAPRCGKTSGSISPGVWYSIKGDGAKLVATLDAPPRNDTQISVFSGSCDMLVCVAGNDDSALWGDIFYDPNLGAGGYYEFYGEVRSSVVWDSIPETVYYILVHGYGYLPVSYTLEVYAPEPPVNDECSGAIALIVDSSTDYNDADSGFNFYATTDLVNACGEAMNGGSPGVWYSVIGTGRRMVASTCGSGFDTQLSVFSGTCGRLECIDGNDDLCSGGGSRVEWESRFGIEYRILINGKRVDDTGAFTLYAGNYPENNECNGAIGLILEQERFFSTVLATEDEFLSSCGGTQLTQSYGMWFFTVGTGRDMNATLCGSSFDTQIAVYSGTCGNLNCQAGNDDFCGAQSAVLWRSKLNTDYYIYVNGFGSSSGDFRILVTNADEDDDE